MTFNEKCRLVRIHRALDEALGDSDPTDDMTDAEMREEYPAVWAAGQIAAMIGRGPWDKYHKPTTDQNAASEGTCESTCSAIPPDYGLVKGQSVYLRCVVSEIKENCVVSVRPAGMGFPSADLNVHRNDIVELPNAANDDSEGSEV